MSQTASTRLWAGGLGGFTKLLNSGVGMGALMVNHTQHLAMAAYDSGLKSAAGMASLGAWGRKDKNTERDLHRSVHIHAFLYMASCQLKSETEASVDGSVGVLLPHELPGALFEADQQTFAERFADGTNKNITYWKASRDEPWHQAMDIREEVKANPGKFIPI